MMPPRFENEPLNKHTKVYMEDTKRKQLEAQLRQLINAAQKETSRPDVDVKGIPDKTQVIRRRKGTPDRHIIHGRHSQGEPALQQ
jgi:hypothetical protein